MGGWLHYLELQAKVKTGLSSGVALWAIIAAVCGVVTVGFILLAAFIWLAERYNPLTSALILGGLFLLLTIIALIACLLVHGRTVSRARLELAARRNTPWLDPQYFGVGLQVARAIGWRRIVPLVAVGVIAAGLAREWAGARGGGGEGAADSGEDGEEAEDGEDDNLRKAA